MESINIKTYREDRTGSTKHHRVSNDELINQPTQQEQTDLGSDGGRHGACCLLWRSSKDGAVGGYDGSGLVPGFARVAKEEMEEGRGGRRRRGNNLLGGWVGRK